MKNIFISLLLLMVFSIACFALEGDISKTEINPDVATWALDTVKFLVFTETCEVTYRKLDSEGNIAGAEITERFRNVQDNPETPEDETSTEFTQLIAAINNGNNIKTTIKNAVKTKLGI